MNSLKNIIFFTLIISIVSKFNDTVNATVTQTPPLSAADRIEVKKCVELVKAEFQEVGLNNTSIYMSYAFFVKDRASFVSNYKVLFFDYVVHKIVPGENFYLPGDYCASMYPGLMNEQIACRAQLTGDSQNLFTFHDKEYKEATDTYQNAIALQQSVYNATDEAVNQAQLTIQEATKKYNIAVMKRMKSIIKIACYKVTLDDIVRNPILHKYMMSLFDNCTLVQDDNFLKFDALCEVNLNHNSSSNQRVLE